MKAPFFYPPAFRCVAKALPAMPKLGEGRWGRVQADVRTTKIEAAVVRGYNRNIAAF